MERLKVRLLADRRRSSVRLQGVEGGGGFAASASDLSVALITWVARTVFSRAHNSSSRAAPAAFFVFAFGPEVAATFVVRAVGFALGAAYSYSGSKSSLSVTTVAGVHVDVDETAALTASDFACNEAM